MPIPDYQTLMLPVLRLAAEGKRRVADLLAVASLRRWRGTGRVQGAQEKKLDNVNEMGKPSFGSKIFNTLVAAGAIAAIYSSYYTFITSPASYNGGIYLTYPLNDDFIKFLHKNHGKIVSIETDISVEFVLEESFRMMEQCGGEERFHELVDNMNGQKIPLPRMSEYEPGKVDCYTSMIIYDYPMLEQPSYGGTGTWSIPLYGKFRVQAIGRGSDREYILREVK
ncbi:hypothetical protein ACM64Y_19000 [Novispirillum sp. DQ9]|uniref:hypothetical protein n=1 Tax=Novispirillum sp. DQ9 TaxID=3398612 RepID=UPI003C7DB608